MPPADAPGVLGLVRFRAVGVWGNTRGLLRWPAPAAAAAAAARATPAVALFALAADALFALAADSCVLHDFGGIVMILGMWTNTAGGGGASQSGSDATWRRPSPCRGNQRRA